jgi:hypothetical protein
VVTLINPQIVTLAVVSLWGGIPESRFQYVDREDIAVRAEEAFPGRFAWRKYPDRVDLEAVCVALRDAKKDKNGALLVGDNATGWLLSARGVRWITAADLPVPPRLLADIERGRHAISEYLCAERSRLARTSVASRSADPSSDFVLPDFYEFALINEYFEARARARRYCIVESAVAGDERLSRLWQRLKASFAEELDV